MEAKLKSPYNSLTVIHQFMCCGPDSGNEIQIGDFFSLWGSTLSDFGLKMAHSLSKGGSMSGTPLSMSGTPDLREKRRENEGERDGYSPAIARLRS